MLPKHLVALGAAAAIAAAPLSRAAADTHGLVGAIIGGAIVGAAINNANKNKTKTVVVRPAAPNPTRAANRETQTALNYFGFPAGTADGVLGRRSRAAISGYQAHMGFPVTGQLTQFERDILVGAYNRGISGSPDAIQLVSTDPDGARALLTAQRDLMTGNATPRRTAGYAGLPIEVSEAVDEIANSSDPTPEQLLQRSGFIQLADLNGDGNNDYILDTSYSGSSFWCSSVQCKTLVFVSTPGGYARNDLLAHDPTPATFNCVGASCVVRDDTVMASAEAPATAAPGTDTTMASSEPSGGGALPLFNLPSATASLAQACASAGTGASGLVMASAADDAKSLLTGHLCEARGQAIADSARMVAGLAGVTPDQVDAQCSQYGAALAGHVAGLSLKPRGEVLGDVSGFVADAGIDPVQLAATARICLGAGYRFDDMDVAIGTGLLLVALGEAPYGELMGHHLSLGLGASERPDLAMAWYDDALGALAAGRPAVFAPLRPERTAAVAAAVDLMSGGGAPVLRPIGAGTEAKAKLPTIGDTSKKESR